MATNSVPKKVLDAYDIGAVRLVKPISVGLIHQTYQIKAAKGTFVMQRLHPILASDAIGKDFFVVTTFLNDQGFPAPKCMLSKQQKVLVRDESGHKWRMQTFLPGKTFTTVRDAAMAREAGAMFGRFHKTMSGLRYEFKSKKILHETEKIFAEFTKTVKRHWKSPLMKDVAADVAFLSREMHKVLLPKNLPLRAIHGDPKISNVLFSSPPARGGARGGGRIAATGIVDLDTCNRRPLLVETGDMFRSWCGLAEDDPNNVFRLDIFRAGWKGYLKSVSPPHGEEGLRGGLLTAHERTLVPKSIATITLELASRFLTDYFNDNYFGWDSSRYPSRRAHNLTRTRGQLALYRDIQKKMPQMKKIVG
jgi:Ser/Thr protein kinase RdoA (MazF antagonist)